MIFVMKEMYNAYVKITDILSIIITLFRRITGSVSDISLSISANVNLFANEMSALFRVSIGLFLFTPVISVA